MICIQKAHLKIFIYEVIKKKRVKQRMVGRI